jgi:hypothetical protein
LIAAKFPETRSLGAAMSIDRRVFDLLARSSAFGAHLTRLQKVLVFGLVLKFESRLRRAQSNHSIARSRRTQALKTRRKAEGCLSANEHSIPLWQAANLL